MTNSRQLLDDYLDGQLTPEAEGNLADWLAADPENIRQFVRETHLHRQLRETMLGRRYEAAGMLARSRKRNAGTYSWLEPLLEHFARLAGLIWSPAARAGLAFVACVLVVAAMWWLNPTIGEPIVSNVDGPAVTLFRAGNPLSLVAGTRLRNGDSLRTSGDASIFISFPPEKSQLILRPGSELVLTSFAHGKRLLLSNGKLEASVSRQHPFRPMLVTTPQAETRVVGTRFTLTVSTNATQLDVAEGNVLFARTSDHAYVQVSAGKYAIAATGYELAALPVTGHILREFWGRVPARSLREFQQDPSYPTHPEGWDLSDRFELTPVETNRFVVRFRGYLHPPTSGDYEFWLAAATQGNLRMSLSEKPEDSAQIAQTFDASRAKDWDAPRFQGPSPWSGPIPLLAGKRYYIEALLLVERGEGHLSVAWKGPERPRELLTAQFLSPFEQKK